MPDALFLVIAGPTASGKSNLAVKLAKALDGEIISADSMQVYRYLDIGTAKQMPEEREGIRHFGLDLVLPTARFTLKDWLQAARLALKDIQGRGKIPILVGGTGLYLDFILEGLSLAEEDETDLKTRANVRKRILNEGLEAAHQRLKLLDPLAAEKIMPQDEKRIIRFFERYETSGLTLSEHDVLSRDQAKKTGPFLAFSLTPERDLLYERINFRAAKLFQGGLLEESQMLNLAFPNFRSSQAYQAIAYKEADRFLHGEASLEEAISTLQQATRRYAKRQLSWFKRKDYYVKIAPEGAFERILFSFEQAVKIKP